MTPEDFDIDFDFDKEYGYDPVPGKSGADDDDFDLDAALARELGPDFDALFEKEFAASQAALNAELARETNAATAPAEPELEQTRFFGSFAQLEDTEDEDIPEPEAPADESGDDLAAIFAARAEEAEAGPAVEEAPMADEESPRPLRRERRPARKGPDLGALAEKIDLQGIGEKFAVVGQIAAENGRNFVDALKECKPGKMDKKQKRRFKNDVLPILIGAAALLMCMIFIIGTVGRSLGSEEREQAALAESIAQAEKEAAAAAEIKNILDTAAVQAAGYNYQAAMDTLDSYKTAERDLTDEMAAARASYAAAMTDLVVWDDPASIPNLSFHVLIEDTERAYADTGYADSYRSKFVTTDQFSLILKQLHDNGYVLVNLESCIAESVGTDGKTTYTTKPIYLPSGKTPIMITETLVNYFGYMTDGDGDGTPDAQGDGFASRLVISSGEIKAEYIDAEDKTHVGDYDLVPILNTFIEANPDFSYRGAKAILAVTGDEGVFGWRTAGDEAAAASAKDIAEILRADGYQIASNSFANLDYSGSTTVEQINEDMDLWAQQITPILGEVDIMVIAKGSGIRTRGSGFEAMEAAGFHYIIDCTDTPGGELTAEYFHQHRIMVTGENLETDAYDAYFSLNVTE